MGADLYRSPADVAVPAGEAASSGGSPTRDRPIEAFVIVAMLGARRHYAVPRLLFEAGLLRQFYTDSYVGNKPWLVSALAPIPDRLCPTNLRRWRGRSEAALPPTRVTSYEGLGIWYARARRRARGQAEQARVAQEAAARLNARIVADGLDGCAAVWGFNTASVELFEAAKARGLRCILEQTMLPRRLADEILAEEARRWPGWTRLPSDPAGANSQGAREEREWMLADRIVAGSEFVREGLMRLGVPEGKVRVVPYGVDAAGLPLPARTTERPGDPLRVLFAGEVGLRKGVPDLLTALARFGPGEVEARLAGRIALAEEKLASRPGFVRLLGPVPRSEMRHLLGWADVFVLPSLVEGSATVTYEALMSGLPVIATPNAGSVVEHGVDGFVVPIRDPDALAEAIGAYQADRALLARHRAAASAGRERAGLDRYRSDLERLIRELLHG